MFKNTLIVGLLLLASSIIYANSKIAFPLNVSPKLIESEEGYKELWMLPLSKYQKVDGFWRHDTSLALKGAFSSQTFLLHTSEKFNKLSDFYVVWASQKNVENLFICKARGCGSSNDWANRFFGDKRLNGLQGKQLFIAMKKEKTYIALYLVERPTGQIYLRVDQLQEGTVKNIIKK